MLLRDEFESLKHVRQDESFNEMTWFNLALLLLAAQVQMFNSVAVFFNCLSESYNLNSHNVQHYDLKSTVIVFSVKPFTIIIPVQNNCYSFN